MVVKCGTYSKQEDEAPAAEEDGETRRYLKAYTVFHASQIEGIEFSPLEGLPEVSVSEKTDRAREIVAAMPNAPAIHEGSALPCCRLTSDTVHMPEQWFFSTQEAYYSMLFHELAHTPATPPALPVSR